MLDHLHDILHYILHVSQDSAVQMLLIILMLALPRLPFSCIDLLLACSTAVSITITTCSQGIRYGCISLRLPYAGGPI